MNLSLHFVCEVKRKTNVPLAQIPIDENAPRPFEVKRNRKAKGITECSV